jgi:hypothetical protein
MPALPKLQSEGRSQRAAIGSKPTFVKKVFCTLVHVRACICMHMHARRCNRRMTRKNVCEVLPSAQTSERTETMNSKSRIENPKCLKGRDPRRLSLRHISGECPSGRPLPTTSPRSEAKTDRHDPMWVQTPPALPDLYLIFTDTRPCPTQDLLHRIFTDCWGANSASPNREGQNQDKTSTLFKNPVPERLVQTSPACPHLYRAFTDYECRLCLRGTQKHHTLTTIFKFSADS